MAEGQILVVDDEPRYVRLIRFNLEEEGYRVTGVGTGEEALLAFARRPPDLLLLDIMLPGRDGFDVCSTLREVSSVPIIMLTAKGAEEDKVRGLQLGADDYVVKPFSAQELMARVGAVLRRARTSESAGTQPRVSVGDLEVDFMTRRVTVKHHEVHLSPTEYRVLSYLAANAGKVVTQDDIVGKVWGPEHIGGHEVLRVTIWRLRQRLGDNPQAPRFITTLSGVGYMLES
ncbi:MAG: response regulator transcription factor [Chloroflexi bacterium]|nr:response regulator transcription factor [Chloroflexota bacterium]